MNTEKNTEKNAEFCLSNEFKNRTKDKSKKYITEYGKRWQRMYNAAVKLSEICNDAKKKNSLNKEYVSLTSMRDSIRKELDLPELSGESKNGDYRANGDAIGGHGLKLETVMQNDRRVVMVNDANREICLDFLKKSDKSFAFEIHEGND